MVDLRGVDPEIYETEVVHDLEAVGPLESVVDSGVGLHPVVGEESFPDCSLKCCRRDVDDVGVPGVTLPRTNDCELVSAGGILKDGRDVNVVSLREVLNDGARTG